CQNTARGLEQDTRENTAKAKEAAGDASDKTRDTTSDMKQDAKELGNAIEDKTKDAAKTTADTMDGAAQTMQIKTALIADKTVDASGINVATDGTAKTVTLKGHVPTAAQKMTAERIAGEKAPGYRIVNQLMVQPGA